MLRESETNLPHHNLPYPDYGEFVGRENEMAQIFKLLRPYPLSRHHLIVIDGIGGIGKSTLALEIAHRCLQACITAKSEAANNGPGLLVTLRQILIDRFSEDELRTLTFDLALDFDMLPGEGKGGKARELVAYIDRRNRVEELIELIQQARPDIRLLNEKKEQAEEAVPAEIFDAIIWTSAKSDVLRASGITPRRQVIRTLEDVYTAIAITLQQEEIIRARPELQDDLVLRALSKTKTLLIVDNLETVDDESVLTFLRELPAPSKAIVTTRHRIDVAYAVRLEGLSWPEAEEFIRIESEKRNVAFENAQTTRHLFERTGGLPLALSWSIAQIAMGFGEKATLDRLMDPTEDVALFCFKTAVDSLIDNPAYKLLLALSLFAVDCSREALGRIAEVRDETARDRGLVRLEKLSLINKSTNRFRMLPLTRIYVQAEPAWKTESGRNLQNNWLNYLTGITTQSGHSYWRWINFDILREEGENILSAIDWAVQNNNPEVALSLAPAIYWYFDVVGRWGDNIRYADAMIQMAKNVGDFWALAGILRQLGWTYGQMGEFDEAVTILTKGLRACDSIETYRSGQARAALSISLGQVLRKSGRFEEAAQAYSQAGTIIDEQHIGGERPETLVYELGKLARDTGEWETARKHFSNIIEWSKEREEKALVYSPDLVMGARGSLALVLYHLGQYQEAEDECLTSMSFFEKSGGRGYYAMLQFRLSLIKEAQGELQDALQLAQSALETCNQLGMKPEIPHLETLITRLQKANNES